MKKFLFTSLCIFLAVITIYYFAMDKGIYYVSIGDYLSLGVNSYHEVGYGYSDYVVDQLSSNEEINAYHKEFSHESYRTIDLINDIENNVTKNDTTIQQALDKATHLTISVGSNDIFYKMGIADMNYNLSNMNDGYYYIREVMKDMNRLFETVKKYNHAKTYVIGFYNPLTAVSSIYARELEPLFLYANEELEKLCQEYGYTYIDIYAIFKENPDFLPNKSNVYPNSNGYLTIAKQILSKME